ncbi:MAG: hypothetical protein NC218_03875 [Acetobacter sp.]|nr:hypothetical protein [Acetobacter sp.]
MVNKIVYMRPADAEVYNSERFITSLQKYGSVNMEFLQEKLDELHYDPLHVSVLVEIGTQAIEDEDKAKQYFEDHKHWIGGNFERLRRITGYLVGSLERWNDGKKAEEKDRVKHGVYSQENKDLIEAEKLENSLASQI